MTCVTVSTFEKSSQQKKENNHDKTELLPPKTFKEMAEEAFGLTYHEILFKAGKELRGISDRKLLDVYMKSRALMDTMKWKVPTSKSKEFKLPVDTNHIKPLWVTQTGSSVFEFGNTKAKETLKEPKPYFSGHKIFFWENSGRI